MTSIDALDECLKREYSPKRLEKFVIETTNTTLRSLMPPPAKLTARTPFWVLRNEMIRQDQGTLIKWLESHSPSELASELIKSRAREQLLRACLEDVLNASGRDQIRMLIQQTKERLGLKEFTSDDGVD